MPAEPITATQTITMRVGMIVTPSTNSRMVRPREMRAMKPATNGEKAMTQHQMNTVQTPFQLSDQSPSGAAAPSAPVQKLIGMKWVKNAPKVWERLERMKTVGPKMNTPTTSTMLRIELASLIRFMPLFTPRKAETAVSPPSTTITRNQTVGPEVMPVKEVS